LVKHQTRNLIIGGLGVLAFVGILLVLIPSDGDGEISIRIPSLSVISATVPSGAVPVGEIECKVRQITQVFSTSGALLETLVSDTLVATPFIQLEITLLAKSLDEISYFSVQPKIFCTQQNNEQFVVDASNIAVTMWGQGHRFFPLSQVRPLTAVSFADPMIAIGSPQRLISFVQNTPETTIHNFIIKISDLRKYEDYPNFDFDYNLEFAVSGFIEIFYPSTVDCPDCSQAKFKFLIERDDINTFYTTRVLVAPPVIPDTDKDGIADENDLCPTMPEDFNGFQDSDGCPDSATPSSPPTTSEPEQLTTTESNIIQVDKTCRDTTLFMFGTAPNGAEFDEQLFISERPICVAQCEALGGTWTSIVGRQSGGLGSVWNNGVCIIETDIVVGEEPIIEMITDVILPPVVIEEVEVTIEEPTIEITIEEEQPSPFQIPPPIFELEQEIPEPQQLPIEPELATREIRPPMADETFLIIIVILIVAGLIAVVVVSRFTKFKL